MDKCKSDYAAEIGAVENEAGFIEKWQEKEDEIRREALETAKEKLGNDNLEKIKEVAEEAY